MDDPNRTPLYDFHADLDARFVGFAGYEMPVQYKMGALEEHLHTRRAAGLFDVSHMGQVRLTGPDWERLALAVEALVPANVLGLADGQQRYGLLLSRSGGILDDLMMTRQGDALLMVLNAACKAADLAHLQKHVPDNVVVEPMDDHALLALQGPDAATALLPLAPDASTLGFMQASAARFQGADLWMSRAGYTGEDGFEISVPSGHATALAQALMAHPSVAPIGLAARNTLRLEAGLCLYGSDMDDNTTPPEAGLSWAIPKVRRAGGARAGGFAGAETVLRQLEEGPERLRVGLLPEGRAPMRDGVELFADETTDELAGLITSGGFGPSLGAPVAMGYLPRALAGPGTTVYGALRGKRLPLRVAPMPFVPHQYHRLSKTKGAKV
ncbi:glycine cleavage system aminomethyltransferase GcvT [Thalassococcus sp. S3]|uniref:glycine cleavage system aminomethyltransferase GcvT n=1 Tax=Thalassococcus sp. S3 TaxID=2017482 RepID=UPI001024830B|nr:glycine cleavage system aminomethyltransferase GcvT [Thalassococcus sp. S3]QBF33007.1 glycine cleavage system protein T [Thalassococcus sp. S3]